MADGFLRLPLRKGDASRRGAAVRSRIGRGPTPLRAKASERGKAGTHMWTAPSLARPVSGVRRIACDHMSGLLSRPHTTAAKMVSATPGPNSVATSQATGSRGVSGVLGSIDHTNCLVSSKLPAFPAGRWLGPPVKRLCVWLFNLSSSRHFPGSTAPQAFPSPRPPGC
jgi:hypothetical protein